MTADTWLAWVAIGAAASLAGMIWAFRRGVLGVLANFVAGIGGAIAGGAIGFEVARHSPVISGMAVPGIPAPAGPPQLFLAGLGAVIALLVLHVAWLGVVKMRRSRPAQAQ
jgi:hypothetical protein